jgi:hypothetical protein
MIAVAMIPLVKSAVACRTSAGESAVAAGTIGLMMKSATITRMSKMTETRGQGGRAYSVPGINTRHRQRKIKKPETTARAIAALD